MKYWTTKCGQKIKISEMTTQHLLNCAAMMERQAGNCLIHLRNLSTMFDLSQNPTDEALLNSLEFASSDEERAKIFYGGKYRAVANELNKRRKVKP